MSEDNLFNQGQADGLDDSVKQATDMAGNGAEAAENAANSMADAAENATGTAFGTVESGISAAENAAGAALGTVESGISAAENATRAAFGTVESEISAAENATGAAFGTVESGISAAENAAENTFGTGAALDTAKRINSASGNGTESEQQDKKSNVGILILLLVLAIILAILGAALLINNKMKNDGKVPEDASIFTSVKAFFTGETVIDQQEVIEGKVDGTENGDGTNTGDSQGTESGNAGTENNGNSGVTPAASYDITVKLGQYKGLTAEYAPEEITEETVDDYMDYFCENMAERIELTEGVVEDYSEINFSCKGYLDGSEEAYENCTIDDLDITVGAGGFIPGFEESFLDHEVGETYSVDLNFPDPYEGDVSLSGKPVRFEITVNKMYDYDIPEISDELIAENTDYKTVDEYRAFVREELEKQAKEEADVYLEEDLMSAFVENCEFGGEFEKALEERKETFLEECDEQLLSMYGMDTVTFYGMYYGVPEEEVMQMIEEESAMEVKTTYAVKELAKQENITVSEEDYEAQYAEFAETSGMTVDEVREDLAQMKADGTLEEYIKENKVRKLIMDNAVITGK